MSRQVRITRETARSDYEELEQFLACYLHQEWPVDHGSPEGAVDDAIAEATPERRAAVHGQLLRVLREAEDDTDLKRILNTCFGVNVRFTKPKEARTFALMIEQKLDRSL